MRTKSSKQEQEIISVTKTCDQYKRTFTNMTNTILKLNENINQTKGKSSQLFNENEWIQCSNFVELKVNSLYIYHNHKDGQLVAHGWIRAAYFFYLTRIIFLKIEL